MVIDPGNPNINKVGLNSASTSGQKAKPAEGESQTQTKGQPSSSPTDSVSLSSQAQAIGRLEQAVNQSQGVDEAKVEAIKQALADGSYQPNSSAIADKMLSQEASF